MRTGRIDALASYDGGTYRLREGAQTGGESDVFAWRPPLRGVRGPATLKTAEAAMGVVVARPS